MFPSQPAFPIIRSPFAIFALGCITAYQRTISPDHGRFPIFGVGRCRFHPSCSEYARQAIVQYGFGRGVIFGLARLGRCHPWSVGGVDPVPEKSQF